MELSRLAAKQKRYSDISRYANTEVLGPATRPKLLRTLEEYRNALASCWRNRGGTPDDDSRVANIERDLETLFNDARLRSSTI
jgi:hypothetical protein